MGVSCELWMCLKNGGRHFLVCHFSPSWFGVCVRVSRPMCLRVSASVSVGVSGAVLPLRARCSPVGMVGTGLWMLFLIIINIFVKPLLHNLALSGFLRTLVVPAVSVVQMTLRFVPGYALLFILGVLYCLSY